MNIACTLITHFPIKAELRRHSELHKKPVIITTQTSQGPLVLDNSIEASGVAAGMPLQEALSRCKGASLLEADVPHYLRVFDRIIEALFQVSPLVEKAELGCAYVGTNGLEAMYGGESTIIASLLNAIPKEFNARLGLANAKFPAYIAAVVSDGRKVTKVAGNVPGFLENLSINLLPISWESKVRLHRFGIHTVGQFASTPVGPVQAQFGAQGRVAWDLAHGIDNSWLTVYRHEQAITESLTFPTPATTLCHPSGHGGSSW